MSMFNKVSKTFPWGAHTVTLETGEIARQATGAVLVTMDDTVVLATVVAAKTAIRKAFEYQVANTRGAPTRIHRA